MIVIKVLRFTLAIAAFSSLAACSWMFGEDGYFPDKSNDYLKAEEAADIELPEHVDRQKIETEYPIPELALSQVLPDKFEVPRVEALDVVDNKGSVRIQRFEGQQWVLVNASASQTWPLIVNFLSSNGVPLAIADGTRGLIETDWLASDSFSTPIIDPVSLSSLDLNAAEKAEADKVDRNEVKERYRFVLKAGVQKDTTEVLVKQREVALSSDVETVSWQGDSSTKLREDNMVKLLSEHLANSPNQASHSLLAQGIGSASKVAMRYDDQGRPYLELQLPFDRAWASLGLALRKASYEVSDLDRSQGIYYAHYVPKSEKEKKRGFFKRLFGIGKNKEKAAAVIDPLRVETRHTGSSLLITIQREAQPLLRANEQAFMLRRIQHKLS